MNFDHASEEPPSHETIRQTKCAILQQVQLLPLEQQIQAEDTNKVP